MRNICELERRVRTRDLLGMPRRDKIEMIDGIAHRMENDCAAIANGQQGARESAMRCIKELDAMTLISAAFDISTDFAQSVIDGQEAREEISHEKKKQERPR